MTSSVEIFANFVVRTRSAVTNKTAAVREREHEAANFGDKWMMLPIASRVHPQNLACRTGGRQRVQHGKNRCHADSRAEQHYWALSRLQNKASARRAHIESIAHADVVAQIRSRDTIRLNLHTDSIALRRRGIGKRVTAKKWGDAAGPLKTQDDVLAWQSCWQRLTVRALHR